jgi:hypothetical protein
MGEISFSYNQSKNNVLSISKQNQGLGSILTFDTPPSPDGGVLNLYDPYSRYYPTTASSQGSKGQLASDGNFMYYGAATNDWVRIAMSDW